MPFPEPTPSLSHFMSPLSLCFALQFISGFKREKSVVQCCTMLLLKQLLIILTKHHSYRYKNIDNNIDGSSANFQEGLNSYLKLDK